MLLSLPSAGCEVRTWCDTREFKGSLRPIQSARWQRILNASSTSEGRQFPPGLWGPHWAVAFRLGPSEVGFYSNPMHHRTLVPHSEFRVGGCFSVRWCDKLREPCRQAAEKLEVLVAESTEQLEVLALQAPDAPAAVHPELDEVYSPFYWNGVCFS